MPNNDGKFHIFVEKVCNIVRIDIIGRIVKEFKTIPIFDNEIIIDKPEVYFQKERNKAEKLIMK